MFSNSFNWLSISLSLVLIFNILNVVKHIHTELHNFCCSLSGVLTAYECETSGCYYLLGFHILYAVTHTHGSCQPCADMQVPHGGITLRHNTLKGIWSCMPCREILKSYSLQPTIGGYSSFPSALLGNAMVKVCASLSVLLAAAEFKLAVAHVRFILELSVNSFNNRSLKSKHLDKAFYCRLEQAHLMAFALAPLCIRAIKNFIHTWFKS